MPAGCCLVPCLLQFWTVVQALMPSAHLVPLCLAWEQKDLSGQIRLLPSAEQVLTGSQARGSSCPQPVHGDLWAATWLIHPRPQRGRGVKKARLASQRKSALGLVFLPCVAGTLHGRISLRPVWYSWGHCSQALIPQFALCYFAQKAFSGQITLLLSGE